MPFCASPDADSSVAGDPAVTVATKKAGELTPATLAWTVSTFSPTPVPTVQFVDAVPSASVIPDRADRLPLSECTTKLTVAPSTGDPEEEVTRAASGRARGDPASPVCPVP